MDREILFRGKTITDNRWVYGDYCQSDFTDDTIHINDGLSSGLHRVIDPKTVGQYTGLKDKNGVKIFEGDIVEHDFGNYHIGNRVAIVKYSQKYCGFQLRPKDDWAYCEMDDCVVIGNVHDNPELVEAK